MSRFWPVLLVLPLAAGAAASTVQGQTLRHIESDPATGSSAAVLVDDAPLVHTPQMLPVDEMGTIIAPGDFSGQLTHLLDRLELVLKRAGSRLDKLAKLNLYVASEKNATSIWPVLAKRFASEARPAVSLVVSPLPHGEALVALDGVAASGGVYQCWSKQDRTVTLPSGDRIYVSGQAESGSLREATRKTLASLSASLQHCGRTDADIVQIKCFLTPMSAVNAVLDEIRLFYGEKPPPAIFVEWKSSSPIEIELVARGDSLRDDAAAPLEFLAPPALKSSPVFSRIARIRRGGTIFIGDCFGSGEAAAQPQLKTAFGRLKVLLEKTGSDHAHLVKATYYVRDEEISKAHNDIRSKLYDSARPPAASKAMVAATGRPGVRYTMDMIAVPASDGTPASDPEQGFRFHRDADAGWINLFDGKTALGWKNSRVEGGILYGGETVHPVPRCDLRFELEQPGREDISFKIGGSSVGTKSGLDAVADDVPGGVIQIGPDVAVKRFDIRPRGLKPLWNGRNLTD